jgi:hypothetical protein
MARVTRPEDPTEPFITTGSGRPANQHGGIHIPVNTEGNPTQPETPTVTRARSGTRADFQTRGTMPHRGLGGTRADFQNSSRPFNQAIPLTGEELIPGSSSATRRRI